MINRYGFVMSKKVLNFQSFAPYVPPVSTGGQPTFTMCCPTGHVLNSNMNFHSTLCDDFVSRAAMANSFYAGVDGVETRSGFHGAFGTKCRSKDCQNLQRPRTAMIGEALPVLAGCHRLFRWLRKS